jgi:hypothetical protein
MKRKHFCAGIFLFLACLYSHAEPSAGYAFDKIAVTPRMDAPQAFVARKNGIEVHFRSHVKSATVDSFPEPPVIVMDRIQNTQCAIHEGGIWARAEVYLSQDGRILLMNEFSGAGSDLVSYDISTCRAIHRLDVSDMRWRIEGAVAHVGKDCTGEGLSGCALLQPLDLQIFFGP